MLRHFIRATIAGCLPFIASAQPAPGSAEQRLRWLYSADVSHSAEARLERGAADLGDFSATLHRGQVTALIPLTETQTLGFGPVWEYGRFHVNSGAPVPGGVYAAALRVSHGIRFNERWAFRSDIRPGLYSDFEDISFDDFNAPLLLTLTYEVNPRLLVALGLNVNFRSDLATIGGPGARWQFADDWTLNLFLPKPAIERAINDEITVYAGGEWRSAAYRVAEDFGAERGARRLDDNDFSYRELRALAGVRWQVNRALGISLEGGYAFQRKIEFRQADRTYHADGAPFVQLVASGSF